MTGSPHLTASGFGLCFLQVHVEVIARFNELLLRTLLSVDSSFSDYHAGLCHEGLLFNGPYYSTGPSSCRQVGLNKKEGKEYSRKK